LLNKDIQKCARQFFTEDAWIAVESTLKMLKGVSSTQVLHIQSNLY
jgi:hypothetical protein